MKRSDEVYSTRKISILLKVEYNLTKKYIKVLNDRELISPIENTSYSEKRLFNNKRFYRI